MDRNCRLVLALNAHPARITCPKTDEVNGHAIRAWLAVLYRRIGAKLDETRQACLKRGGTSHLFIVLDKAKPFVAAARSRMERERM
jgi:hypothetical protein